MQPVEHTLKGTHGVDIVYDVWPPDPSSQSDGMDEPEALVLVAHGLGEHKGRYHHVAARLAGLGLRVAVPDHQGHGRSGGRRLRARSIADFSADMELVRRATQVPGRPAYVVGHSMGGCIALDYALDHQDDLAGLVLSGAAVVPGSDLSPTMLKVAKVLGRVAPSAPTQQLDSRWVSRDDAVVAAYDADPLVHHGKIPAGIAAAMLRTMDSFPRRLPSLRLPLLVVAGGADRLVDPEGSRLVERLAGSSDKTLRIYDDLYHEVFNEPEQKQVLDDVATWLRAHLPAE